MPGVLTFGSAGSGTSSFAAESDLERRGSSTWANHVDPAGFRRRRGDTSSTRKREKNGSGEHGPRENGPGKSRPGIRGSGIITALQSMEPSTEPVIRTGPLYLTSALRPIFRGPFFSGSKFSRIFSGRSASGRRNRALAEPVAPSLGLNNI